MLTKCTKQNKVAASVKIKVTLLTYKFRLKANGLCIYDKTLRKLLKLSIFKMLVQKDTNRALQHNFMDVEWKVLAKRLENRHIKQ